MQRSRDLRGRIITDITVPAQQTRALRVFREPLFLMPTPRHDAVRSRRHELVVGGSGGTPYTVSATGEGVVGCTCPDARTNCSTSSCVCKHVCFVLLRVLRLEDLAFFVRRDRVLSPEELRLFAEAAEGRCVAATETDEDVHRPIVVATTNEDVAEALFFRKRKELDAAECPVCYAELTEPSCCWCPACSNAMHTSCAGRWLRSAPLPTCVLCRSPVWQHFPARLTEFPSRKRRERP